MKFRFIIILLSASCLQSLQAATLVFNSAFNEASELSTQLVYENRQNIADSLTLTNVSGGALDGTVRATVLQNDDQGSDAFTAYLVTSSQRPTFTPSSQGAIESLTFSIDQANILTNFVQAPLYFPALIQNDTIYLWDTFIRENSSTLTTFTKTFTNLDDFDQLRTSGATGVVDLGTTGDVDATITGSEIEFALIIAGSTNSNNHREGVFDNVTYSIDYAAVPEVSSFFPLVLSLGMALAFRRPR